ncbi:alpha/beta-hydrolase [Dacryopinax primogenitus]|uniref:Alpha/beta-hydrolase n=1 Tax=Dacryopinax primogenitus (strain DJM 731) TaxID=1858805 RepID=M5GGW0_DACPD|nr:alpha/beta-hydrolase [Dacryopinax primogenitus]EJU06173.1 alpha/beta-hydrolase [Dacryopinax primogenitus]
MASAAATLEVIDLPPLPPAREVPLTWSDSIHSWWASTVQFEKESVDSEERLLRRLPSFLPSGIANPSTNPRVISRITSVPLPTPSHTFINMLSILPSTPVADAPEPTVLLHGYAAGLGFYFQNLPFLANEWVAKRGGSLYALDWLGMGRSARVPFKIRSKGVLAKVLEAESFFVDSLEEWRKVQKIDKMALVGHSLGGYLSVAYTLKYPQHVSRLVLLSPAGVPTSDFSLDPSADPADGKTNSHPKHPTSETPKAPKDDRPQQRTMLRTVFRYLWESGISPFTILRMSSFYGPLLVSKYSTRRFPHLSPDDIRDMHNYMYHISRARGSGEFCISHILAPGAYAYYPIVNRIRDIRVPVAFVYGDHDWMDPAGGLGSVERLREAGNDQARMYIIQNAGHHVYLDNADAVNQLMVDELLGKPYEGKGRLA